MLTLVPYGMLRRYVAILDIIRPFLPLFYEHHCLCACPLAVWKIHVPHMNLGCRAIVFGALLQLSQRLCLS